MTHMFGVRSEGRAGGSWFIRCCNANPDPAGIVMLGEIHCEPQLDFPYSTPNAEYDVYAIGFLDSQVKQGRAAVGLMKGIRASAEKYLLEHGARFASLVHHPLEPMGAWKGRRGWGQTKAREKMAVNAVGHYPPQGKWEEFTVLCYEMRARYLRVADRSEHEPTIRIEDLNRSVGTDGVFFQAVLEWLTRVPFPFYYIDVIRKWFLPGDKYPLATIRDEQGIVRKVVYRSYPRGRRRQNWQDDTNPAKWWHSWTAREQALFLEYMQGPCERLGYNCTDNPGYADVDWPQKGKYPWAAAEVGLKPILPE